MIDQILERENYVLAKKLLDVSHARHQALAGNLANAETPGYKRSDTKADFAQELQKLASGNDMREHFQIRSSGWSGPELAEREA